MKNKTKKEFAINFRVLLLFTYSKFWSVPLKKFRRVKNSEIGINRSDCRDIDVISRKMALFCIFLEHIETRAAVLLNTLNGKLCRKKTLSSEFPMVLTVKTLIQILDNLSEASWGLKNQLVLRIILNMLNI